MTNMGKSVKDMPFPELYGACYYVGTWRKPNDNLAPTYTFRIWYVISTGVWEFSVDGVGVVASKTGSPYDSPGGLYTISTLTNGCDGNDIQVYEQ